MQHSPFTGTRTTSPQLLVLREEQSHGPQLCAPRLVLYG